MHDRLSQGLIGKFASEKMLTVSCLPDKVKRAIVLSALQKLVRAKQIQDVEGLCPDFLDNQLKWDKESAEFPEISACMRKEHECEDNYNALVHLVPL